MLFLACCLTSCRKLILNKEPSPNAVSVFEYLWKEASLKYAYFDYKGVNWNDIREKYKTQVYDGMPKEDLFNVLAAMLNELKDAHVNLISPFNVSNYFPVFLNSPENFDDRLVLEKYLLRKPEKLYFTGPLANTIIDTLGLKIGYISYRSFLSEVSEKNMDYVLDRFAGTDGIIIDVRNNGGGSLSNVFTIGNRFTNIERKVYLSSYRKGPGANDFESEDGSFVSKDKNYIKRVAVLTNRGSYSATSFFALAMRTLPHVRVIGDTTGGGLGIPNGGELPNGWTYRFSVSRTLSIEKDSLGNNYNWENGVPPHIKVGLDKALAEKGFDSIIERAFEYIKNGN